MSDFKIIARQTRDRARLESLPKLRKSYSPMTTAKSSPKSISPQPTEMKKSMSSEKLPELGSSNTRKKQSKISQGKCSINSCGIVEAYAANSFRGSHHNEDRVSIIINIQSPANIGPESWPKSSFFALFDGHSGKECANYLKKQLYSRIFQDKNYPFHPQKAIKSAFHAIDKEFLALAKEIGDFSGSCAILALIIGDKCYVANTGDSRAILSLNGGKSFTVVNTEHKPTISAEHERILAAGGSVFNEYMQDDRGGNLFIGEVLVIPGKLKVSRAFGDLDAKDEEYGGNSKVLICEPDVRYLKIKIEHDFIALASAPLFGFVSGREIVEVVNKHLMGNILDFGKCLLDAVKEILIEADSRGCDKNMTLIVIAFKGIKKLAQEVSKIELG
jgi:protein phosphatase 2C family protein 2/3